MDFSKAIPPRPLALRALALVPAMLLAGCGLWPDFPSDLLHGDGGDAHADGSTDARDGGMDAGPDVMDAGMDAATTNGGFRSCPAPTVNTFMATHVVPTVAGAQDLAFDGHGHVATATDHVTLTDSAGIHTDVTSGPLSGVGLRFLPNGMLAVANYVAGGTSSSLAVVNLSDGNVNVVFPGLSHPSGVAVDGRGGIYVTDVTAGTVSRVDPSSSTSTPALVGTVTAPRSLAISPDYRKLVVGSEGHGVFLIDLRADGTPAGDPQMYAQGTFGNEGLAFDACGYLYVSDAPRNRIMRVPPGGGEPVEIVNVFTGSGSPQPAGLAFGSGLGFDTRALYFVDINTGDLYRVPVDVDGAAIVMPPR